MQSTQRGRMASNSRGLSNPNEVADGLRIAADQRRQVVEIPSRQTCDPLQTAGILLGEPQLENPRSVGCRDPAQDLRLIDQTPRRSIDVWDDLFGLGPGD